MSNSRDIADSAATINFIDTVTSNVQTQLNTLDTALDNISVTSGTLTKTFTNGESASISLTSSVLVPNVSVTKEVPQSGATNNNWDVNSTSENYTRLDSAAATTLSFVENISESSFVDSFSIASEETVPEGLAFNPDGTKMFIVGRSGIGGDAVYEYTLSTGFNVSSATYVQNFSVATQDTSPQDLAFNADGTKLFIVGRTNDNVYEYALTTGFDISTASYTQAFSIASQETNASALAFNTDGTKMFILGYTGQDVNEYALSAAFDISTASFTDAFSIGSQETQPQGMTFNTDGTKMFICGFANDSVFEYILSTGFDVSTASYSSVSFSVSAQDGTPSGIEFSTDGSKMFIVGQTNDSVYHYTVGYGSLALGTGSFTSADVGKTIEANSGVFVLTATSGSYVQTTAPTSYNQVASGSWSMYGVVYNTVDGDLELSSGLVSVPFDVSNAAYSQLFSITGQETNPYALSFNTDGTKMFVMGLTGDAVSEYSLTTGFDVSTASFVDSFSVAAQEASPTGMTFNTDGTKMFIVGAGDDTVFQYTLSTGFDVSTASYAYISFNVGGQDTVPIGIAFNTDGTKMFVVGSAGQDVNEYTLSTGFNVSTASFVDAFSIAAQDATPRGITFSSDGTKMFVVGSTNDSVFEYNLSVGFDVSSAVYSQSFSTAAQEIGPTGIAFNTTGTKMFIVGTNADSVIEYSIDTIAFATGYQPVHTTNSIDTTYWTDINSMTADQAAGDGNVYYAISTDDRTTWTVIDNTDGERDIVRNNAGTWQYNSNGTYASETWANGATNTELATIAEAMEGASYIAGFDVSTAVFVDSFSVAGQETNPQGVAFSTDGTKMFVVGNSSDNVNEYALTTGFDVSTASFTDAFSVAAQEIDPNGLAFNTDGTKMFVIGNTGDDVNEYALGTGFDVSTASFTDAFSVAGQENFPTAVAFNSDGTKMFIVGTTGDSVYEYALTTGFDVSTASYSQSFSVTAQETTPQGLAFSTDGTKMFVVGYTNDNVNEYALTTGFDVSTASFTDSFSIAAQENLARGLAFNADGSKMFVVGSSGDDVNEYTVGTTAYTNQMDKTQLDAVTDPNHIALGNDLDLAIVFNMTSGTTVPSSDGVAINYDANILNKGAVLGTDYDFDAPTQNSVRITALAGNNLKVRVV